MTTLTAPPAPWEQRVRGRRWVDMPGNTKDDQKYNFALYRMGKLTDADLEAWEADKEEKLQTGVAGKHRAKRRMARTFRNPRTPLVQLREAAEQKELDAITIPKGADDSAILPEPPTECTVDPEPLPVALEDSMALTPTQVDECLDQARVEVKDGAIVLCMKKAQVRTWSRATPVRPKSNRSAEPTLQQVLDALAVMGRAEQEFWRLYKSRYQCLTGS